MVALGKVCCGEVDKGKRRKSKCKYEAIMWKRKSISNNAMSNLMGRCGGVLT